MKRKLPRPRKQQSTMGVQLWAMKKYPSFQFNRKLGCWLGSLQPLDGGTRYRVKIGWSCSDGVKIWVTKPKLKANAPHLYADGSLCLYYPPDGNWTKISLIADTIVPWTMAWLFYYELWLETGECSGPTAPHRPAEEGSESNG